MTPSRSIALMLLASLSVAVFAANSAETVSRKGWFADEKCSTERIRNGRKGPPGQACTRECIRKGVRVVFIDEGTGALYRVDNPKMTKGLECDYVELAGTLNAEKKTVRVDSVHVLVKYAAHCSVE
jgi:hypothetical protein